MILLFWVLFIGAAHADVVFPPPGGCPEGTREAMSHSGSWCAPGSCEGGCATDQRCAPKGICVVTETRACGGRRQPSLTPCTFEASVAMGSCEKQEDCAKGKCEIADRCVNVPAEAPPALPVPPAAPPAPEGASTRLFVGCQSAPAPAGAAFAGIALLSALALRRRAR